MLGSVTSTRIDRFQYFLAKMLLREYASERLFVFSPHFTTVSALPGKPGNAEIAPFNCCVNGLPEFSQLLLDFFNIADLQLIFVMSYDSVTP